MKDSIVINNPRGIFSSMSLKQENNFPEEPFFEASQKLNKQNLMHEYTPEVSERILDIYSRAKNPHDPFELRNLYLGRVEAELGKKKYRKDLADFWKSSIKRREFSVEEVLNSNSTTRFVKELFNFYFRDDLYGALESNDNLILSSGAVHEESWGLPNTLKDCIRFSLEKDWYGYSDSRGRNSSRSAIAEYENMRMHKQKYNLENVVITMGATFAINSLADFILKGSTSTSSPALCGIPNYPPLVESISLRHKVQLVPLQTNGLETSIRSLIEALGPNTPMVMLQTVLNPNGTLVNEEEIKELILKASSSTIILLDECHEWLGPPVSFCEERSAPNVIRVSSLSKSWSAPGLKVGWFMADSHFVDEYYEHASTTYGGPPSFYYTLLELLAKMEQWVYRGVEVPDVNDIMSLEEGYNADLENIQKAYINYKEDRKKRAKELIAMRDATINRLSYSNAKVLLPEYSINFGVEFPNYNDSYLCFRELLRDTSVSLYPGILNFCFSGSISRVTFARPWDEIKEATQRIMNYTTLATSSSVKIN